MDTVTLTIDGTPVTVEKGRSVLQAAIEAGISVPYYCYHPGLGVDGSCRVCIVKIEKMPKLQTSCSTACTEGMVVSTRDPDVVQARAGVFEFLLVNHPLDCPVCDKGGECPLQDFSYTFGPANSRMDFPRRVFDGDGVKADVDFGLGRLDLDKGWATLPRTKNGNKRRCPLWPETVEALRVVLKQRKTPEDRAYARRVFITQFGEPYRPRNLSRELGNAMERAGMGREERDFYDLRRTCVSVGVQVSDDDAVRTITGHRRAASDMLGVYNRMAVSDDRLRRVTDHIHRWLFTESAAPPLALPESDASAAPQAAPVAQAD